MRRQAAVGGRGTVEAEVGEVADSGCCDRIVDKQLFNYKQLGLVHMVFPDAAIVETTRSFMDVAFSIFRYNFNEVIDIKWIHIFYHFMKVGGTRPG
jgi:hypothetical protein